MFQIVITITVLVILFNLVGLTIVVKFLKKKSTNKKWYMEDEFNVNEPHNLTENR